MNPTIKTAVLLGLATAASSQAQIFQVGNHTALDTFAGAGGISTSWNGPIGAEGVRAVGFKTGGVALTLDHIAVQLSRATGSATPRIALFNGDLNGPTSVATEFTESGTVGTGGSVITTDSGGSFTLAANTIYWLLVERSAGTANMFWNMSDTGTGTDPSTAAGNGYEVFGRYSNTQDNLGGTTSNPAGTPNFAIYTTTAVPEPHEYALIAGLGLCGFAVYRRRMAAANA